MAINQEYYNTLSTDTKSIVQENGVNDLPFKVKAYLARALKCEREGNDAEAAINLDKAVQMEQA